MRYGEQATLNAAAAPAERRVLARRGWAGEIAAFLNGLRV
jgi:hypothetical protein